MCKCPLYLPACDPCNTSVHSAALREVMQDVQAAPIPRWLRSLHHFGKQRLWPTRCCKDRKRPPIPARLRTLHHFAQCSASGREVMQDVQAVPYTCQVAILASLSGGGLRIV